MVVFYVLILGIPPVLHKILYFLGYPWIGFVKVKQGFGILDMVLNDLLPPFIIRFGIVMVHSNHVCGESAAVVDICFVVGHGAPDHVIPDAPFIGLGLK